MIVGIFFIVAGILIALYPPLLALVVATLLIYIGVALTMISWRFKKMHRHFSDPFADFFIRF